MIEIVTIPCNNINYSLIIFYSFPYIYFSSMMLFSERKSTYFKSTLSLSIVSRFLSVALHSVVKAYWSADDVWIIIAIIPSSCIYVWDSVEGTIVNLIKTNLAHMMPHPVLPQLLATVVYGEIQLWDLTRIDDEPIHIFCTNNHFRHCNASKEVIWSPDGTVLIAPRSDGMLIMFNLTKGIRVIHAPTRAERLERRRETSTDRNIPNNADTSNNSSPAQLDFLLL